MWKLLFFIPLIALTVYIFIKSREEEEDPFENNKSELAELAVRMLYKGKDYANKDAIECEFDEFDFSDENAPYARFTLFTDKKTIPFKAEKGQLIRYKDKQ